MLTISAHGNARYFKRVDAFVATAPDIPGWQVQALEEPMPLELMLTGRIDDAGIDPQAFRCALSGDPHRPVLTLYHPHIGSCESHMVVDATGRISGRDE